MKKKILAVFISLIMVMQALVVYGELPSEATSTKYYEIPVYFKDAQTSIVTKELSKTVNETTLSGKAVFYIRAFAYETGDKIKIGSQVNFIGADGKLQQEWWDQNITTDKATINWPACDKAYVVVNDDMKFVSETQNIDETRVIFSMTVLGNTFSRATGNIKLDAGFGALDVVLQAVNADNSVLDVFKSTFVGDEKGTSEKIFSTPILVDPGAKVNINIKGNYLEEQEYTVINSDVAPKLPLSDTTKWESLGDLEKVEPNVWEAYPDLLKDKQGYLSTKHYNYKYGEKTSTDVIPARANTFGYPIGEDNVIQLAKQASDNQYNSVAEEEAFFSKSYTGQTNLVATFVPSYNVSYQFAVYTNDKTKTDYVPKVEITDNTTKVKTTVVSGKGSTATPFYHGYQGHDPYWVTYNFTAGKTYTFNCSWRQSGNSDPVPSLFYRTPGATDWTLIPSGFFDTEKYVGGANKAVKFWGYMVPDGDNFKDGKYNLGSYADDGVYGYLMINNERVEFAENWTLSAATDRTGVDGKDVNVELKKGVVYPIYMEWYEGRPTEKSFIPRYKESGSKTWKDIPSDWFYASADSTPGRVNIAYFDSYTADSVVKLPEDPGTYYVAVKVTNSFGEENQVLQGPFKIEKFIPTPPSLSAGTDNKIVPTSVSNISLTTNFVDYTKAPEYAIDVTALKDAKITVGSGSEDLLDMSNVKMSASIKSGGSVVAPSQYTMKLETDSATGKLFVKIKFANDFEVGAGKSQQIQLYFIVDCGNKVEVDKYTNEYAKTNKSVVLSATVSGFPGHEKKTINIDGSITSEIVYETVKCISNEASVTSNYYYIPQIH